MATAPEQIGSFVLERQSGAGGMGTVWRARHVETAAVYALKLLPASADFELIARFRREGEAMGRVRPHPNLVRVHAFLEASEHFALVLEFCSGGDLQERLRTGPIPPREAAALVASLASGLGVAHAAGVLHRDLKPANVIFDGEGRPKLTDFGLAKLHDQQSLTQTGALLGTPAYMAPEQAMTGACDARTDVYGLGGVLYHCLSGAPAFQGTSVLAILDAVLNSPPPPLPAGVPSPLRAACLRALAKDPGERFESAESFRTALLGAGGPSPTRSPLRVGGLLVALTLAGAGLWASSTLLASVPVVAASLIPSAEPPPPSLRSSPTSSPTSSDLAAKAVPGLLPWPRERPRSPSRAGQFALLEFFSTRSSCALGALATRARRFPLSSKKKRPSLLAARDVRSLERSESHLRALVGNLTKARDLSGFLPDLLDAELFMLGLARAGDQRVLERLEAHYTSRRERGLAQSARAASDFQPSWWALGKRVRKLLRNRRSHSLSRPAIAARLWPRLARSTIAELTPRSPVLWEISQGTSYVDIDLSGGRWRSRRSRATQILD
ncbi:MAG: serine/threonine protein kinase [Planctomycetes bacterium]|nr:serine/threonine protein kinase [Planctomycetota bacterium]